MLKQLNNGTYSGIFSTGGTRGEKLLNKFHIATARENGVAYDTNEVQLVVYGGK